MLAETQAHEADSAWCAPAPIGQPPFDENLLDAAYTRRPDIANTVFTKLTES